MAQSGRIFATLAAVLALAACESELVLEGERLDVRGEPIAVETPNRAAPISLSQPVNIAEWTHRNGALGQPVAHPALRENLARVWSAPIGQGTGTRHRITAMPVAAGGRIYTLDSRAMVTATSTSGETLWQRDLRPDWARRDSASGGGLAVAGGRLYVASAFGQLVALDAATGADVWTQRFDAPVTGAPTVVGNRLYVMSTDSTAWAMDTENGRLLWESRGAPAPSSIVGGASPAVAQGMLVLPYPSGDLAGLMQQDGIELWRKRVAGSRPGRAYAGIRDITADPVVVGDTVFVGNHSGRVMALALRGGETRWTAREAAMGPVWVAGGSVFLISDEGRLVRLDASSGETIWAVRLPHFVARRDRDRTEIVAHHGPILAGGRVIVASGDGALRSHDPVSGELVSSVEIPRGAATAPIVVDGTLYVVSNDGMLHAFR